MKKIVISIEEKQVKEHQRFDLIGKSITLAFQELGYSNLSINRLEDKDEEVRFEICDKDAV